MNRLLRIKPLWALIVYIVLNLICVGMGMGVPFFCILFGFIVGWYIVRYITFSNTASVQQVFPKVLKYAMITSAVTLFGMLLLWVPFATYLFEPAKDLAKSGIPMILYEPKASFIAWIVLMILISPFLQLLTTLFSAYLTLLSWMNKRAALIEI